jgi:hypothetical protein
MLYLLTAIPLFSFKKGSTENTVLQKQATSTVKDFLSQEHFIK